MDECSTEHRRSTKRVTVQALRLCAVWVRCAPWPRSSPRFARCWRTGWTRSAERPAPPADGGDGWTPTSTARTGSSRSAREGRSAPLLRRPLFALRDQLMYAGKAALPARSATTSPCRAWRGAGLLGGRALREAGCAVLLGFGRIVAQYCCLSTLYQICGWILQLRCLFF